MTHFLTHSSIALRFFGLGVRFSVSLEKHITLKVFINWEFRPHIHLARTILHTYDYLFKHFIHFLKTPGWNPGQLHTRVNTMVRGVYGPYEWVSRFKFHLYWSHAVWLISITQSNWYNILNYIGLYCTFNCLFKNIHF